MKSFKIQIITQGCKVNLLDSEILMSEFIKKGLTITNNQNEADAVIINSCTVTAKADRKFIHMARKIKRDNPKIILCGVGCYTELNKDSLEKNSLFDIILGSSDKFAITDLLINNLLALEKPSMKEQNYKDFFYDYEISNFTKHTRAFLKIQDGCDNYCAYCTIPYARGKSRSRNPLSIIKDVEELAKNGYKELVLSGICLGDFSYYVEEDKKEYKLIDVLRMILKIKGFRVRLGSIEPWCFTNELVDFIIENNRMCPHLHLPLQAASDKILKKMNRHNTLKEYSNLITRFAKKPNIHISADVIVGFPDETDEDFNNGVEFIKQSNINSLHVFSYSDRPLARASKFPNKVNGITIKKRSKILRDLAAKQKVIFMQSQLNKKLQVLIETIDDSNMILSGYSENYLPVSFKYPNLSEVKKGDIIEVCSKKITVNDKELQLDKLSADDNFKIIAEI